jgi:hypothetical protein
MDVIISPALPINPTDADDVVRTVRHGLHDVLEWLGEDVGPKPGEPTGHMIQIGSRMLVSQEAYDRLIKETQPC